MSRSSLTEAAPLARFARLRALERLRPSFIPGRRQDRPRLRQPRSACSAGSAPSRCAWPPPPRRSAARSTCASRSSTRKCRRLPNGAALISRRDVDDYDAICDHLLVLDHDVKPKPSARRSRRWSAPTGCCARTSPTATAASTRRANTTSRPCSKAHPDLRFLELGRSCVLKPYRNKRTVELLWHGIWTYVLHHRIDVMIGCASLEGTDPQDLALPLSFLHHYAAAPSRVAGPRACRSASRRWTSCPRRPSTPRPPSTPCRP